MAVVIGLLGAPTYACLALRRVRPLLMVTLLSVLAVTGSLLQAILVNGAQAGSFFGVIALLVASYSLGAHGTFRELALGAPQPVLLILAIDLLQPGDEPLSSALPFAATFVVVAPVVAGRLVRARARLVDRLQQQAAELSALHAAASDAELTRERLRLAEEVHGSLLEGMESLADQVEGIARRGRASRLEDLSAIEQGARQLLGRTRGAVVTLAATEPQSPGPPVPSFPDAAQPREVDAEPWTTLAAAALGAGLLVELPGAPLAVPGWTAVLAVVALVLPLALAPVAPLTAVTSLWLLAAAFDAAVSPLDGSFTAIGLAFVPPFVVAALASRARAVAGLAVCLAGELLCLGEAGLADAAVVVVLAWIAGLVLHDRRSLVVQLRRNAVRLDRQRRAAAAHAILQERARLARDLHDALGHSLTVVALQAGAARRWWDTDRERSLGILDTLAVVTRDGLADLRDGMGTTVHHEHLADRGSLTALVERARAAGLPVVAHLDDVSGLLDPEAGVVVYRVVQESLTNVMRHAPGATTEVGVRAGAGQVEITVRNAAPTRTASRASGSGRGLDGMLARAVARGGAVDWGPRPDGGFQVRAHLPTSLPSSLVPS